MTHPVPSPTRARSGPRAVFVLLLAAVATLVVAGTTAAEAAPAPTAATATTSPVTTAPSTSTTTTAPATPPAPAPAAPGSVDAKIQRDAAGAPGAAVGTDPTATTDTITTVPAPAGDTPDPRADIIQYGANYGTNSVVIAVQTASYTASGFDALWDIDTNGDGVVDYDVFFPSGNIRRDADFLLLCGGTPLVAPSSATYLVSFPAECIGNPASFRTRTFTQFGDSVDFAPHDNISWSQWVARGNPPFGSLDNPTSSSGALRVTGWAIDPDVNGPVSVAVTVDGAGGWLTANVSRPDVGAAYPTFGPNHGYDLSVGASGGLHQVCAAAINDYGPNVSLGCKLIAVPAAEPIGNLDAVTSGPGQVTVGGWTLDPNTAAPLAVHVYADGTKVGVLTADKSRPDIGAAFPGYGNNHGFNDPVVLGAGVHTVCAYAINVGPGTGNTTLGCRTVTVGGNPIGNLDEVVAGPGSIRARGWAIDPDTASPISVHIYVDGALASDGAAATTRNDIAAAFPAYGATHGFNTTIGGLFTPAGTHQVCVYAINTGAGSVNPLLGCRTVTVGGNPFGSLDTATVQPGRFVSVTGWAIDPDLAGPVTVHLYIDGAQAAVLTADVTRGDIGGAFPDYGPDHGFAATTAAAVTAGTHTVCAYAINTGAGTTNTTLGCRSITA